MLNKLLHLGSTQANENFNYMVAQKAPKAVHYSDSASLHYRIAASVANKNEGHTSVNQVNIYTIILFVMVLIDMKASYLYLV